MPIDLLVVALVGGAAFLLALWRDGRRSVEPDGPRPVAVDSALEGEQERLADRAGQSPHPAGLVAAERSTSERGRQISVKLRELTAAERERRVAATELAKQEAALAQRARKLEWSLAEAERSAAESTAQLEAREAALAAREAGLQQQESELTDRHRSLAERERELITARAVVRAREEGLGVAEADLKASTDRVAADHERLAVKRSGADEEVAGQTAPSTEESELEQREQRVAEFEVGLGEKEWSESDWWEKQLGRPLSAKK